MYIRYNNFEYGYRNLPECKKIVTRKEEKSDETFYKNREVWVKIIEETDPNIQDIFDIKFYVTWDSKLENVITKWSIHTWDYFSDGSINLYHEGHLPDWRIVEKGISQKCIKASQVEGYAVEYKYIVKDGKKLDEPLIEEREVLREEFEEIMEIYDNI